MHGVALDREQVHDAALRLPERQRQALTRLEAEQQSYEEIAAAMGIGRGSVAQLIARARINLYDELRGTPLASAVPSAECERALPLIAAREDGQLEDGPGGEEATWLDAHLVGCERCRLAVEQMGEAAVSHRAAEAASAVVTLPEPTPRLPGGRSRSPRRRRAALASGAAILLLGVALAALASDDGARAPTLRAADAAVGIATARALPGGDGQGHRTTTAVGRHAARRDVKAAAIVTGSGIVETPASVPASAPSSGAEGGAGAGPGASGSPGKAAIQPKQPTSAPASHAQQPSAATTSQPSSQAAEAPPPAEETTAAEKTPDEPGHRGEPPGHSADHPPKK